MLNIFIRTKLEVDFNFAYFSLICYFFYLLLYIFMLMICSISSGMFYSYLINPKKNHNTSFKGNNDLFYLPEFKSNTLKQFNVKIRDAFFINSVYKRTTNT